MQLFPKINSLTFGAIRLFAFLLREVDIVDICPVNRHLQPAAWLLSLAMKLEKKITRH